METTNLSKIKREKMLNTINELKRDITDEKVLENISLIENELNKKKYGLIWEEHEERVDKELETKIPTFEEIEKRKIMSIASNKFNFLLEGDNLHSLYLLKKTHAGKIDLIYIDPPYNTGNNDFIYNDKCIDNVDSFRHSKWLSFMGKRIEAAKEILSENGIIFISIDEYEYAQLKILCDDIFGEYNYIENFIWIKNATKNNSKTTSTNHEYILCYCKNIENIKSNNNIFKTIKPGLHEVINFVEEMKKNGKTYIEAEKELKKFLIKNKNWKGIQQYKNIDQNFNIFRISDSSAPSGNGARYEVLHPETGKPCIVPSRGWAYKEETMQEHLRNNRIYFGKNENCVPQYKRYLDTVTTDIVKSLIEDNTDGKKEIMKIFNNKAVFNNPKPTTLLRTLINMMSKDDITVLDFFAGSGTTGHAVLELNKEDGGNRKFILCTNNENNICEEITYKRLENVINGYGEVEGISDNLKYYKTAYIPRMNNEEANLHSNLLINIKNLIQLENGIEIDDKKIQVFLEEENLDKFSENKEQLDICDKIYISSDILITSEQEEIFKDNNIEVFIIPEYYFEDEIMEVM